MGSTRSSCLDWCDRNFWPLLHLVLFQDDVWGDANHQWGRDSRRGKWKPRFRFPVAVRCWFPLWAVNGVHAGRKGSPAGNTPRNSGDACAHPGQAAWGWPWEGFLAEAAQYCTSTGMDVCEGRGFSVIFAFFVVCCWFIVCLIYWRVWRGCLGRRWIYPEGSIGACLLWGRCKSKESREEQPFPSSVLPRFWSFPGLAQMWNGIYILL